MHPMNWDPSQILHWKQRAGIAIPIKNKLRVKEGKLSCGRERWLERKNYMVAGKTKHQPHDVQASARDRASTELCAYEFAGAFKFILWVMLNPLCTLDSCWSHKCILSARGNRPEPVHGSIHAELLSKSQGRALSQY